MAENIPYKVYKGSDAGKPFYRIMPGTNKPTEMTEAPLAEAEQYYAANPKASQFEDWNYYKQSGMIDKVRSGETAVVSSYKNPLAPDLTYENIRPEQIEAIKAENVKIASGEYVNVGTSKSPRYVPAGSAANVYSAPAAAGGDTAGVQGAGGQYGQSSYTGVSIVDYLKSVNQPSDYASRATLAQSLGIQGYAGTAEQNTKLLGILRGQSGAGQGQGITPPPGGWSSDPYEFAKQMAALPPAGQQATQPAGPPAGQTTDVRPDFVAEGDQWNAGITQEEYDATLQPGGVNYKEPPIISATDTGTVSSEAKRKEIVDAEKEKEEERVKTDLETITKQAAQQAEFTDLDYQAKIKNLKEQLGITEAPTPPVLQTTYDTLRSENGIEDLETQMNANKSLLRDMEASLRQGLYDEEGKLRPMELIGTHQRELQRQGQEQIDTITRANAVLVDEYNTKLNIVNQTMQFTQQDYANASTDYQNKFNTSLKFYDMIKTQDDELKNVALANLDTLSNYMAVAITSGSITSDAISQETQNLISKLELSSGQIPGITMALLNVTKKDVEKIGTITSEDNSTITVMYADGSTQVFNTGMKTQTAAEKQAIQTATSGLNTVITSIMSNKKTWDTASSADQQTITDLAKKAGIDLEVVKYALNTRPDVAKLATQVSDDGSKISVIYEDGTRQIFDTGITGGGSASNGFKFSSDDKGRLLEVGLTNKEITDLQNDINQVGLDGAIEGSGMSEDEQNKVRNVLKGVTPTQERAEEESKKEYLDGDYINATFSVDELKSGADVKKFSSMWRPKSKDAEKYVEYLVNDYIPAQRKAGFTDDQILDAIKGQIT